MSNKLSILPLGGLGEIGKNSLLLEYQNDAVLIDAGLMFPEEEMVGIDLVLPDFNYVYNLPKKLWGIVLTHGHEDHVGALPYFLRERSVPLYGTPLTLRLVKAKLEDYGFKDVELNEVKRGESFTLGPFHFEFIRVNHSIPDGVGLAIKTPLGVIVHSGDFKFDPAPINDQPTDLKKFASLGSEGVLLLLSDSTNSEVEGFSMPERIVGETLEKIFSESKGKIIVASFASHIHRIQQVIELAKEKGRKLVISGRSMKESVEIASELGYLSLPDNLLMEVYQIKKIPPRELVVLCTGSQGEPLSALSLLASGHHKHIKVEKEDTVVIAATPIPGNERSVSRIINYFYRLGADVFYEDISSVHVSGHAYREELKLLLNMIKPRYFVPIHGEFRHLKHHAEIAKEVGVEEKNIFLLENGDMLEITKGGAYVKKQKAGGVVYVDGLGVGDIQDVVLRDRRRLSQDGIVITVLAISISESKLVSGPEIISRGFVQLDEARDLIEGAKEKVVDEVRRLSATGSFDWSTLKGEIKETLGKYFYRETGRHPMIIPIILEV
jgi:ribonuclease J